MPAGAAVGSWSTIDAAFWRRRRPEASKDLGILAIIACGLFTASGRSGYRSRGRRIVCEGSQARKPGRKEPQRGQPHCVVIDSSVGSIRHGPCVDVHRPQETCDRDPDDSVCHRRGVGGDRLFMIRQGFVLLLAVVATIVRWRLLDSGIDAATVEGPLHGVTYAPSAKEQDSIQA